MIRFNAYLEKLDFTEFRNYFIENGTVKKLKNKEYYLLQDNPSTYMGFISSGAVHYTRYDSEGREHVVGYSFSKDFACDYTTFMYGNTSLLNIQAIRPTTLYSLTLKEVMIYIERDIETQRFGRLIAQEFAAMMYDQLISFYCDTPEERYCKLLKRFPNLPDIIPLKEIASYIGVTPETVSHIRKKLAQKD